MDQAWLKALCDVSLYLDRFDSPRWSLAFRRKEAGARIFVKSISYKPVANSRKLVLVTHRVVDYSLRGVRTKNLPLKSLACFNKSSYISPLVMATWSRARLYTRVFEIKRCKRRAKRAQNLRRWYYSRIGVTVVGHEIKIEEREALSRSAERQRVDCIVKRSIST